MRIVGGLFAFQRIQDIVRLFEVGGDLAALFGKRNADFRQHDAIATPTMSWRPTRASRLDTARDNVGCETVRTSAAADREPDSKMM